MGGEQEDSYGVVGGGQGAEGVSKKEKRTHRHGQQCGDCRVGRGDVKR